MELRKGENMVEHETEIYARPARTWFQSVKEKRKSEGLPCAVLSISFRSKPYSCEQDAIRERIRCRADADPKYSV